MSYPPEPKQMVKRVLEVSRILRATTEPKREPLPHQPDARPKQKPPNTQHTGGDRV